MSIARSGRDVLRESDTGINQSVSEVGQEVAEDNHDSNDQENSLRYRKVLVEDGVDQQLAETRPCKEAFHDNCAGEEIFELKTRDRDRWQERIAQRMFEDDNALS